MFDTDKTQTRKANSGDDGASTSTEYGHSPASLPMTTSQGSKQEMPLVARQLSESEITRKFNSDELTEARAHLSGLVTPGALPVRIHLEPEWMEVTHLYAAMERYTQGLFPTTASDALQAILGTSATPSGAPKVVGISSAVRHEGKTTVAMQLAINVARNTYKKVALVDLSMRSGALTDNLELSGKGGIVPVLEGNDFRIPTLQMEGLENLSLLPLGTVPKNPVKTAYSPALFEVMAAIREMFDLVIVDLPEITSGYTLPLLQQTDGLLVVIASGITPKRVVQSAIDMVGKQRVIGVILNGHKPAMPKWLRRALEVF